MLIGPVLVDQRPPGQAFFDRMDAIAQGRGNVLKNIALLVPLRRNRRTGASHHRMWRRCSVLTYCPICKRPLKPDLTDRPLFGILGDASGPVQNLKAYSCGPKGHIIIFSETSNGFSRLAGPQQGTDGGARHSILNSWKEIATYLGRGVRTVQRWEADLGLPVHRPKGRDRSAVLALADELDLWVRQTPVRLRASAASTPASLEQPPGWTA